MPWGIKMTLSSDKPSTNVIYGDRIGRKGVLRIGCSALLFDDQKHNILLTRRSDNGQWCLPGGMFDPGESVQEGCQREIFEETGLKVAVVRLSGIYSDPNRLIVYPDGNKAHVVVLAFEVKYIDGDLLISDETLDARYFPVTEAIGMDLFHGHAQQIHDAVSKPHTVKVE
jgi:ADP-ribose pyrophosphatase YjhB (NUDIX family)